MGRWVRFLVCLDCCVQQSVGRIAFTLLLQFWGFIGTLAFLILFIFYPVCLAIGLLGTYPSLITNYIWPVIKNVLIGLFVVQSLTIVFKFVAKIFLVLNTSSRCQLKLIFFADEGWGNCPSAVIFNIRREYCTTHFNKFCSNLFVSLGCSHFLGSMRTVY